MPEFVIGDQDFLLDGKPFRILSGALHYFRVHPDLWADRIEKARLMGLNTIETYVPWNAHSPTPDAFITSGMLDLDRFLRLIKDAGMSAIVRPGPYICAEWDNGGLPAWLFRDPEVGVRRNEPIYLAAVQKYLKQVFEIVAPQQIGHNGPVILVQVENEYGAFGRDKQYLKALTEFTRDAGITVPLITVDQPVDDMLADGNLDGLMMTASFGSRSVERLTTLRSHQPTGPLMCGEYWIGWFDHWGGTHNTTSTERAAADLDELLSTGASVNIYMFHGGTNFGFTSGANDKGLYQPLVTSYDYDAPLDEAGNPTAKYFAFREVISRYAQLPEDVPKAVGRAPEFSVPLGDAIALLDEPERFGRWQTFDELPTIDDVDPTSKLMLLRAGIDQSSATTLVFGEIRDRVAVFVNAMPVGVLQRDHHQRAITLPPVVGELLLLVEDQGRVNYGSRIGESKGIIGGAELDEKPIRQWDVMPIDVERIPRLWKAGTGVRGQAGGEAVAVSGPVALRATFQLDTPVDLYLDTTEWGKGAAWINGFPLGRYWRRGPQQTLYVPGPALRAGSNELVILELEILTRATASFVDAPGLGPVDN